jgi:predicted metal-dependent phosphoesterase TrpH
VVTGVRLSCIVLLAGGIALGSMRSGERQPEPMAAGGYTVLAGDFHVHGWPDGIPPWDAIREAARRRLDVVALTSHNSLRGWWMWSHAPWRPHTRVLVLPGEELTSVGYHMALVGLTAPVGWQQPAAAAAGAAHAQGAVAILAHPAGGGFQRFVTARDLAAVDGIEVAHPEEETRGKYAKAFSRARAVNPRVAAIGSSDFHYVAPIGLSRTYVFVRAPDAAGVLDAIRAGRTVACDGRGDTFGPAELSRFVTARCRADASLPPVGDTVWSRAGAVLSWTTLLALVLAGSGGIE